MQARAVRFRRTFFKISGLLALLTSCSHYYLPTSRLDSPETQGTRTAAHLDFLGIESGVNLTTAPAPQPSGAPKLPSAPFNYSLGFSHGVTEKLDLGARFQAFAPTMFRAKYQFIGRPEDQAARGDFSGSVAAGLGYLVGSGASYLAMDLGLLGGWRMAKHHLLSLEPFFSLADLSDPGSASTGSTTEFGAALGYQYEAASLFLHPETLAWFTGSSGSSKLGGWAFGLLGGLRLGKE